MRTRPSQLLLQAYIGLFFVYLFLPLAVMGAATFNLSRFPTITPWTGTTLKWFGELWADERMWQGLWSSIGVGLAVVLLSVPIGTGGALLLEGLHGRARTILYAFMVSPLLTPGVIIGISTLVFWGRLGVGPGLPLVVLGQTSFISAYTMLLVLARLQRFDRTLEEAALDLGASHAQAFRRVLLPHLVPALGAAAVLAFFQSFENFNTTIFLRGVDNTLTVYIASKVRTGVTPAVNALGLILILLTLIGAVIYETLRRREARAEAAAQARAAEAEDSSMVPSLAVT
jgi:spermidine/putrescine transport system permease protein